MNYRCYIFADTLLSHLLFTCRRIQDERKFKNQYIFKQIKSTEKEIEKRKFFALYLSLPLTFKKCICRWAKFII